MNVTITSPFWKRRRDQIVDVGLAVELANTARNRTVGGDF